MSTIGRSSRRVSVANCRPAVANAENAENAENATVAGSNRPNHSMLARALHGYLRWRNAKARHPDVLAAQGC